jgi:hypothetical protein
MYSYTIILIILFFGGLFLAAEMDLKRHYSSPKARWYLIHMAANIIVVIGTLPAVYLLLTEHDISVHANIIPVDSVVPSLVVMALHLFHALCYKLSTDDKIHHTIMLTVLLVPLVSPNDIYLCITNHTLFFMCGLPGAIDYYLMFRVETGEIEKITEKRYNVVLNTWIRAPGILFGAFRCHIHMLDQANMTLVCIPVIIALIWNAQYYSSQVSQSYGRGTVTRVSGLT